jgi:acyl carrier protein
VRVLQLPPGHRIDADRGLKELGLDSLMAVELRNRLQANVGRSLPVSLAFDCPTVAAIANYLVDELDGAASAQEVGPSHAVAALDEVHDLSEEEATALLVAELARPTGAGRGARSDG